MEIVAHSNKPVAKNVSKENVPFHGIPNFRSVMYKMIQLDTQSQTKKSDSQCCQESNSTQKPLTHYDSATLLLQLVTFLVCHT